MLIDLGYDLVTHPFHPLAGGQLSILFERRYRSGGLGHVYIRDGGEFGNVTLPESITDRGPTPEPQPLCVEGLMDLLSVMRGLRAHEADRHASPGGGPDGTAGGDPEASPRSGTTRTGLAGVRRGMASGRAHRSRARARRSSRCKVAPSSEVRTTAVPGGNAAASALRRSGDSGDRPRLGLRRSPLR